MACEYHLIVHLRGAGRTGQQNLIMHHILTVAIIGLANYTIITGVSYYYASAFQLLLTKQISTVIIIRKYNCKQHILHCDI